MRILVIGVSGRTGSLVVAEALRRGPLPNPTQIAQDVQSKLTSPGHKVTALVRNPTSLPARDNLKIVAGTPLDISDITKAFLSTEAFLDLPQAVVTTLNAPRESDSPFSKLLAPPRFMADSISNVREVMKKYGVKKLVIMSA